ncbi:MAG: hypothetical protein JST26_11775 [Bacteroidetes bacterium]|nr:hypothetical protein [Bacteroidota bacterium]
MQYKMSGDSTFLINSLQVKTADFIKYYYSAKENIAIFKDFGELDFKYDSLRSSKRFTELGRERLVLLNKSEYVVLEKDKLGNPFLFILKDTTVLGVKELDRSIAFGTNEMILLDVDNDGSNEIIVFSYNFIESRPSVVCSVFKW